MSDTNEKDGGALVTRPSSAVEKAAPGAKHILAGMVKDMLAVVRANSITHSDLDELVREGKQIQLRQGLTPEDIRAFDLFHRAAIAGHREAQLLVFECYLFGYGVRENLEKALEWFRKPAEAGFANAQYDLGNLYRGTHDFDEAIKWYRKAADQGDASAQCSLGLCYYDGEGVHQNYAEAIKWVRKAAEQGDIVAQKNLGVFYDRGHGVKQNDAEAAKWYRKAAEQGNAGAQNDLGVCYETGQGVPKNHSEAIKWYRKSAAQRNAEALPNLARCCVNIVGEFTDFLASHSPLIGDCSLLPFPKEAIHYSIASVLNDYESKRADAANQVLREKYDRIIPTLKHALTRLVGDWQEIDQKDKEAIARLSRFDSFPDWALPLKLKYLDDERARNEACDMAIQVMADRAEREKSGTDF